MRITITPGIVRRQLEALGRVTSRSAILQNELTDDEVAALAGLYPKFRANISVKVDDLYQFEGKLYKVVQAHTTQADWTPPTVPALWTPVQAAGVIPAWVQPTGAQDAYDIGAQVTHDNPNASNNIWIYESAIAANTTQPGRDGTFDRYWTPVSAV